MMPEMLEEEDFLATTELCKKTTETMIEAFKTRFPVLDLKSLFVITSSCGATALSAILSLPDEEKREILFQDFITLLRTLYKEGSNLIDK